jgi:hypothetical protein
MGATAMTTKHTSKGIDDLNAAILGKAGEKFTIEDLYEWIFESLGEKANDYDLKLIRGAVAYQEEPLSFVWVFDWSGTEEDFKQLLK